MLSKILCASMIFGSVAVYAQNNPVNMSDSLDKNIVPASQETREKVEEPRNLPDRVDRNVVPAPFEERQMEEEAIGSGKDDKNKQKMEDHSTKKDHSMQREEESMKEDSSLDSTESMDSTDSM